MEKLYEKKNFGIPVIILTLLAYFIGYSFTLDYSNLLVAVIFAILVFSFQFDEKVKSAVKQSYIIAFLVNLIYLGFDMLYQLTQITTTTDYNYNHFQSVISIIYKYGISIFRIGVVIIFFVFLLNSFMRKDTKINFISKILGEGTPKPAPVYPQQGPMMGQPPIQQYYQPQMQQPMYQQPMLMPGQMQGQMPAQPPLQQQPMPVFLNPTQQPIQQSIPQSSQQTVQQPDLQAYQRPIQQPAANIAPNPIQQPTPTVERPTLL